MSKTMSLKHYSTFTPKDTYTMTLKRTMLIREEIWHAVQSAVIIDFGKSTKINSSKQKKTQAKQEQKIVPEIVSGQAIASAASDVYSFRKLVDFICKRADLNLGAKLSLLKNLALSRTLYLGHDSLNSFSI